MALMKRLSSAGPASGEGFEVNWTARSLVAAGAISGCLLLTALNATAAVERAAVERAADVALADEAALLADLADYLKEETAGARAAVAAGEKTAALSVVDVVESGGAISDLVDFDFTAITVARADAEERHCLAQAIYFEAANESRVGQLAVADVVLNRVKHPAYPNSICGVVFEGSTRKTGCQFTFTCDGSLKRPVNRTKFERAEELAGAILAGMRVPASRNATHYHADYVEPVWAAKLTPTATIGTHKFYRFARRIEVAEAPATM